MMRVLMLTSLLILSSGCTSTKVQNIPVYPNMPVYEPLQYPAVSLEKWGDYKVYKLQCEAIIDTGNLNVESLYNAAKPPKEVHYE